MKKFLSMLLAAALAMSLTAPALAANGGNEIYDSLNGTADSQVTLQVINSCEHAGEKHYEDNGDGTHKEICNDCGETTDPSLPHTDGDGDGNCDACGAGTGPCKHGNASYIDNGDGTHDKTCNDCHEVIIDNEQHYDTDADRLCDACGAEMPAPASLLIATVPVKLPILMQLNGIITVPINAVITNHVTDKAIAVKDIALTASDSWMVRGISEDFYALLEDSNNMAVSFRGDSSNADGNFTLTPGNWNIGAASDLVLNMAAKIPLRTATSAEAEIATAAFTLTWATDPNATTSNDKTGIDDQKVINGELSTRVVDITIDPLPGTIVPDNTHLKTNTHGRIESFPTAIHPNGYEFLYWKDSATDSIVDTTTVFTSATTIYPVFDIPVGTTITFVSVDHCQVTPATVTLTGDATMLNEAGITISTTLDDGYKLSSWKDSEGNIISDIQTYKFSEDTTVTPVVVSSIAGWKNTTLPSSADWFDITYGDGKFVAIARNDDKAAYSTDGINWTATTMPLSAEWMAVTYGNGTFVAIADDFNNEYRTDKAAYSTDGVNWTETTMPSSDKWHDVTYGDGKFVAIAYTSRSAAYSTDGINWTETTMPSRYGLQWERVTYGDGKFVAVAANQTAAYSTDGINWIETTMPSNAYWDGVTYGNKKFVAFASMSKSVNNIAYSTDGINWTATTLPLTAYIWNATYSNGKFIAIAYNTSKAIYSTDGINWIETTLPSPAFNITYGDGKFVTIARNSNTAAYCEVS